MAHFAEINENNIVTRVIVVHNNELLLGEEESEQKGIDFCQGLFGHRNWVQTSYNGSMRYNFAGIGYTWDKITMLFIYLNHLQVGRLMKTFNGKHQYHILKTHQKIKYTSGMKKTKNGK